MIRRHSLWLALALTLGVVPALFAQSFVRLQPDTKTDTLSSNGDSITMTADRVGGFGSVKVQTLDSYSGTWEVQCSVNGSTFDADSELSLTKTDGSSAVFNVTDTVGIWTVNNANGCKAIKIVATAGFAASDTAVALTATQTGGSGGSGGGGGAGTSDTTEATQLLVLAGVDGLEALLAGTLTVGSHAVTNAGTFAVQESGGALTALQLLDNAISGAGFNITQLGGVNVTMGAGVTGTGVQRVIEASDSALSSAMTAMAADMDTLVDGLAVDTVHDSPATTSGPPLMAYFSATAPAAVDADGDGVRLWADANGRLHLAAEKLEDVASAGGDVLMGIACIRDDTLDARSVTEGDYEQCHLNANGALWTVDVNSAATIFADEAAFTYATSKVQAMGAIAESTTDAIADGLVGAPVMTLLRQLRVVPTPSLSGGGTGVSFVSAGSTEDEHAVCTGPCTVYSITAMNHTAASAFLRCENDTAANTTPGSETNADGEPDIEIPASTTGAGFTIPIPVGVSFSTALTCWIVSDEAASGVTEVAANDVRVWYVRQQ